MKNGESQEGLTGSSAGGGLMDFREVNGKKEGEECPQRS